MADRKLSTDKSERILNELLKIPVNTICCDCGAANPKWASHSLGCFVCVRCCSFHRKMGVHISKIKSVSMDSWTQEEIDNMKNWGNGKVNALYLPNPERHPPPISMEGSAMEQYIRSKYERKEFMEGGGGGGGNLSSSRSAYGNTFSGGRGSSNDIVNTQSYTTQMSALRSMGFTDNARNLQALQATNGHVADAVEILCRIGSGPVTASPSLTPSNNSSRPAGRRSPSNSNVNSGSGGGGGDAKENMLRSMGFNDTALIREALRRAGGNTDVAATLLIDEKEKLVKAVHGGSSPSSSSPLPSRLDPPGANKTQSNLLIDVSTPEDNQQQQQQQQLQQMQMQMQMQNAFGNSNQQWPNQNNSDQFGQNQNQLQSILDKNASILAFYGTDSNNNNNNMFGNNAMNNGAFGLQPQPTGNPNMNTWTPGNNINMNINSSMAMNSAFGTQTSMPTGNNMGTNMFGGGANPMGMGMNMGMSNANTTLQQQQLNPFGMANQQGMGNTPGNNAFGTLGNNNMFTTTTSSVNSNTFMAGTTQGMNPMGQTMGQNMGMGMNMGAGMGMGMNNTGGNNAFNPAFGMNQNSGSNFNTFNNGNNNPGNPWGGNNNNNNNNNGFF